MKQNLSQFKYDITSMVKDGYSTKARKNINTRVVVSISVQDSLLGLIKIYDKNANPFTISCNYVERE